ncbi:MAG: mechanosensitive ion channel [bacterium]|nr:mechanosensitive ion channel [bacterium]
MALEYWNEFVQLLSGAREALEIPLIELEGGAITIWTVCYVLLATVLLFVLTKRLSAFVAERLFARSKYDVGVRQSIGSLLRYATIAIGMLIIIQSTGIDLTTLTVLAGAVGVGLGFGLQNIADNFISGLIILFERPIKIGDRVEVDGIEGTVLQIGLRSTTILTNDDISIIIPNSKFIAENVINWSHTQSRIRFRIPVGVSFDSDVEDVERALLDAATEHPDVLEHPAPVVRFLEFGDSALNFDLRVFTSEHLHRKGRLVSELNFKIFAKFKQYDIRIPFPQRDLHVRTWESEAPGSDASTETRAEKNTDTNSNARADSQN